MKFVMIFSAGVWYLLFDVQTSRSNDRSFRGRGDKWKTGKTISDHAVSNLHSVSLLLIQLFAV